MAEVLQVPRQPDGQSFYQSSPLRRSQPSSSSLFLGTSPSHSPQPSGGLSTSPQASSLSSSPIDSSYDLTDTVPFRSSPLDSAAALEEKYSTDDDFTFPNYSGLSFLGGHNPEIDVPPPSPDRAQDVPDEEAVEDTTTDTTRSDSPLPTPTVADDTAIKPEPSRHVDYLSHEWREEDIWSSWRLIVSQRKTYGERSRLENASWRTWAKSKYNLRTISPETLNWLKESDVTWLYGPLQPATSHPVTSESSAPASNLSKSNSFLYGKKPILKKRSMSEVMLQRSISTSSLLKQAAASVQAQQTVRPYRQDSNDQTISNYITSTCPSEYPSRDDDYSSRTSSSISSTPCGECGNQKRHIRFDEKVEQCIAVECKEGDFDDDDMDVSEEEEEDRPSSGSDDGLVMMRRKKRPGLGKRNGNNRSRSNSLSGRKMIETLPASTLKSRTDSPDTDSQQHQQQQYTFGSGWTNSKLSPSASQETLKPSNPYTNFLIGNDDDEMEDAPSSPQSNTWSFSASNTKSSLGSATSSTDDFAAMVPNPPPASPPFQRKDGTTRAANFLGEDDDDETLDAAKLKRTNSGMFMPYGAEDDEDDLVAAGLFGRVSETINTAKDIAHVIWNVGWNK